jgi:serine-type D-Ala-D-Ala carboxypeptidase
MKDLLRNLLPVLFLIIFCSCSSIEEAEKTGFEEADRLIEQAMRDDLFTGAVLLIAEGDDILHHKAYGFANLYNEALFVIERPDSATTDHLFDLASLTKIFATTYGIMALHGDGLLGIDTRLGEILPEFDTQRHSAITVRMLLNHTSGILQWYPTYYAASNTAGRRLFLAEQPLAGSPGEQRRYSDPGFMLLGDVIEAISETSLDLFLNERIYSRLGLQNTLFNPEPDQHQNIVATSHGNPFEKKMVYEPGFGYNVDVDPRSWDGWRNYTLRGEVNDGNAWYTHGGLAGHAGLFSTAGELHKLLQLIVNSGTYRGTRVLNQDTIALFTEADHTNSGLGWAMTPQLLHADELPQGSVGHTGFTGTNFILHPESGRMYILLTNRQHVGVDADGQYPDLRPLRQQLAELVFDNSE